MKGTVAPPSRSSTAALTCSSFTPSSVDMRAWMDVIKKAPHKNVGPLYARNRTADMGRGSLILQGDACVFPRGTRGAVPSRNRMGCSGPVRQKHTDRGG